MKGKTSSVGLKNRSKGALDPLSRKHIRKATAIYLTTRRTRCISETGCHVLRYDRTREDHVMRYPQHRHLLSRMHRRRKDPASRCATQWNTHFR